MTERDYFRRLEARVSSELAGMRRPELRDIWCDGFIPEAFEQVQDRCRLIGSVWIAFGQERQECWRFVIHLGAAIPRPSIEWESKLPEADWTGWLSMDFTTRFLKIDVERGHHGDDPARDL